MTRLAMLATLTACAATLLAACAGSPTGPEPRDGPDPVVETLEAVTPTDTAGQVETTLAAPLTVRVERDGEPASGVTVHFEVVAGGGELSTLSVTTDAGGEASTTLTLGPLVGQTTEVLASAVGREVTFRVAQELGDASLGFDEVSAGRFHTCGLDERRGLVYCWGRNTSGELGTTEVVGRSTRPVRVQLPEPAVQLEAGTSHSCAVVLSGRIYCWGVNAWARIGNNGTADVFTPEQAGGDHRTYRQVSAGVRHSCAVGDDGDVYCWGQYLHFPRGGSDTFQDVQETFPQPVTDTGDWRQVSASFGGACALTTDGRAFCLGPGLLGQNGNDTLAHSNQWVPVAGGHRFEHIQRAARFTCGLTTGGQVLCWGQNSFRQLGTEEDIEDCVPEGMASLGDCQPVPVPVAEAPSALALSAQGINGGCLVGTDERAYCWGHNISGQRGNGEQTVSSGSDPARVNPVEGLDGVRVVDVTMSDFHACAATESGDAYCWGRAEEGQVGTTPAEAPGGLWTVDGSQAGNRVVLTAVKVGEPVR